MNLLGKRILYFLLFLMAQIHVQGQILDAGLWNTITLQKKLGKSFKINLSEELRFNNNISQLSTAFTELGGEYKINKRIKIESTYRFIKKKQADETYSSKHRINVNLQSNYEFDRFRVALRESYQTQFTTVTNKQIPETTLRSKASIRYSINKRIVPNLAFEIFNPLFQSHPLPEQLRYSIGTDIALNKKFTIGLFYLINQEINVNNPLTEYVLGLNIEMDL